MVPLCYGKMRSNHCILIKTRHRKILKELQNSLYFAEMKGRYSMLSGGLNKSSYSWIHTTETKVCVIFLYIYKTCFLNCTACIFVGVFLFLFLFCFFWGGGCNL